MDGRRMDEPKNLAEWLRMRMAENRTTPMTLRQVTEYADVSPTTVKRILDGERVKADTVLKLAEWSHEPFARLLELAGRQSKAEAQPEVNATLPSEVRETLDALGRDPFIRPQVREWLETIIRDEWEKWAGR